MALNSAFSALKGFSNVEIAEIDAEDTESELKLVNGERQ